MKKLFKLLPIIALFVISLSSCGNVCVRCENGLTAETETECFGNKGERNEYVIVKESQGFTCNDN